MSYEKRNRDVYECHELFLPSGFLYERMASESSWAHLLQGAIALAYLVHTALDWLDERYRAVRARLPSRRTFFENLCTLLLYLTFDSWDHLMDFMLKTLSHKRSVAPDLRANPN